MGTLGERWLRARSGMALALLGALAAPAGLVACARQDATAVEATDCRRGDCADAATPAATDAGSSEARTAGGGIGSGLPRDGGGTSAAGGDAASDAGPARPPLPDYTLEVDAPGDGDRIDGIVTVRGRSAAFQNIEVWDATHQMPPLAQTSPTSDGSFSLDIDTASLTPGATTWTVWGWDSPPGQAYMHSASVALALTIGSTSQSDAAVPPGGQTIGTGDVAMPAVGPAPSEADNAGGAPFVLVKNWDFGTNGTITDVASLSAEFQFHDQFNTIANGTHYGAVIVAPTADTAISQSGLGLPGDMQPVEDPARPMREWTADSLKTYVRPLSSADSTISVSAHNAGCGSLVARWKLPNGGALLGKDLLWETRARMPVPQPGYWYAFWSAGNQWNNGAEMDVMQSFGSPNIYPPPNAFHADTVGGSQSIDYSSWPGGLSDAGVPESARDLRQWHTFSWLYRADDTYVVYYDGIVVQSGSIHWTLGGAQGGQALDLSFLFDLGWGHTDVASVDISLPASSFPLSYELDYSRVYLR